MENAVKACLDTKNPRREKEWWADQPEEQFIISINLKDFLLLEGKLVQKYKVNPYDGILESQHSC